MALWRYGVTAQFHEEVHTALRKVNPEIVITHNAFAFVDWAMVDDHELTVRADDVATSLIDWQPGSKEGRFRFPGMIWRAGLMTRFLRDLGGSPVLMQVGNFMYGRDYQSAPVAELRLSACFIVTNGGSPVYITNAYPDGSVDEIANERIGEVFRELRAKAPYLANLEDLPFAALFYSKESRDYSDATYADGRGHLASFEGAYKALLEEHIPFQILGPGGLTSEGLEKYQVLVLADVSVLSGEHGSHLAGGSMWHTSWKFRTRRCFWCGLRGLV